MWQRSRRLARRFVGYTRASFIGTEERALELMHWAPLRRWLSIGGAVFLLWKLEMLVDWALLVSQLHQTSVEFLGPYVAWLVDRSVQSGFRVFLGFIAVLGTLELVETHKIRNGGRPRHLLPEHLSRPVRSLRDDPIWSAGSVVFVTLCWYLTLFPPCASTLASAAWRAICVSGSGLFLCASLFEAQGWKYIPLSALCLYFSGSKSCRILLVLDGVAVLSHSFEYCKRLYFLHEAKRDFHNKVRRALSTDSFHPAFVEESFERLMFHSLGSKVARRMAFAVQRCLSFGTQARLLRQNYERLKWSLQDAHKRLDPQYVVEIERDKLLESTFQALQEVPTSKLLAQVLRVKFRGELGEDDGGLLRDWFDSIGHALKEEVSAFESRPCTKLKPLLMLQPCDNTFVLRPGTGRNEDFFALGRVLALAVHRGTRVPIHLSRAAWKLLIGDPIDASDVYAIDPVFFTNRIAAVLEPGGVQTVSELIGEELRFVSAESPTCPDPVELIPGGAKELVTEENKLQYVEKLCEFYLIGQVQREWQLLRQGFEDLLPFHLLREHCIGEKDLELLIVGLPEIDVKDWQRHTAVDGPMANTPEGEQVVRWFWEVVEQFGDERKAKLLQFATGSSRLPADGFAGLEPCFCIYLNMGEASQLPTASTCANQLNLCIYPSRRVLIEKLKIACHETNEGFGLI